MTDEVYKYLWFVRGMGRFGCMSRHDSEKVEWAVKYGLLRSWREYHPNRGEYHLTRAGIKALYRERHNRRLRDAPLLVYCWDMPPQ